jgi:hypothetical protein
MREWALMMGGLIVWAGHFFALYAIASIFPGTQLARTLTVAVTVPALALNALLLWTATMKRLRVPAHGVTAWMNDLSAIGAALSFVFVLWQATPAFLV